MNSYFKQLAKGDKSIFLSIIIKRLRLILTVLIPEIIVWGINIVWEWKARQFSMWDGAMSNDSGLEIGDQSSNSSRVCGIR